MTDTFWIIAAILIILALGFVVWPVFRTDSETRIHRDQRHQNLLAYRSRMAELEDELEAGAIDQEHFRLLQEELAGSMIDDVPEESEPAALVQRTPGRKGAIAVALASVIVIPAAALYLYQQWGAMDELEEFRTIAEMSGDGMDRPAQMSELAERLRNRLEAEPENAQGWAMLGRTYMSLERFDDAAYAYRRLAELNQGEPEDRATAWGLSAQAAFFASQGDMTRDVRKIIAKAREFNPDEVNALGLLGIHAFSEQQFRQAIEYWQRIVEVAPDHPQLASIKEGIRAAYTRLGEEPPVELAGASDGQGPGVSVSVTLGERAASRVPDDAVVFVFARAAGTEQGPPLAVVRLAVSSLPARVTLNDSNGMGAGPGISSVEAVQLTARVSLSGNATAEAGDWQGRIAEPVVVGTDQTPVLMIDSRVTE